MQRRADERAAQVPTLVREHLPGYRVHSVALLGEGLDNVVYEINGELMVRFCKAPDPGRRAARADREARLLTVVAGISPLPVPEPRFVAADQGCFAYAKIPGVALLELAPALRPAHAAAIAATLGNLLAALHAIPAGRVAGLVNTDDEPLVQWRQDAWPGRCRPGGASRSRRSCGTRRQQAGTRWRSPTTTSGSSTC